MADTKEKVSNTIPDDIVFNILSKLPVKSLKRFGCVRKSWANLFESPQFMSLYRNNFLSEDDDDNSRLFLKQSTHNAHDSRFHDSMFLLSGERFENRVKSQTPIFLFWSSEDDFWGYDVPDTSWHIYNLRSNSWRKLDIEMPYNALYHHELYLNGVCHWWDIIPNNFSEMVLVSFNLSDEMFHTTLFDRKGIFPHLAVLKGSIAIITSGADIACFDILILGELGVKESWTKLFSIGPLPGVMFPIGFGKKGNIFFRKK